MNLFIKQKQTHKHGKQIYGYKRGKGEMEKLGIWDLNTHSTRYKIDKQQVLLSSIGN